MSDRLKKRKSKLLKHPCADLAVIWAFRILINLEGWKDFSSGYSSLLKDGSILRTLGLGHLEDSDMADKALMEVLNAEQEKIENRKRTMCPIYQANLKRFTQLVGLSKTETRILNFALVLHHHRGLDDAADTLGELNAVAVITALACILDLPERKVQKTLSNKGLLARAGILKFTRGRLEKLQGALDLMYGLGSVLFGPQTEEMFNQFFQPANPACLKPDDYGYRQADYQLIRRYLQKGQETGLKGVNILVHGVPGTGKTELARTLSEDLGFKLYEISTVDEDGDPLSGSSRFNAYQLSQQVLSKRDRVMIVFDEIEDVFPSGMSLFGPLPAEEKRKAWVNRQLEENPVPAIWISNDIDQIDNAYIRRFDYVLNLEHPPRKVREAMLDKYLQHLPVSKRWIERAAANQHLAPALISRAAKVVSVVKDSPDATEQALEKILGNTLNAMGFSAPLFQNSDRETLSYRLDALNPDRDIEQLVESLKTHAHGRLCLYGPPGTGKSEFGRFIAKQRDQPLLVKRASDILNAYLGGTEKRIAAMFKQAREDQSVLLLDEADSFLQNRNAARHNWEVTQVNELLTQMEDFNGLFICSTNLIDSLDAASIRRFDLKIKFDYLRPDQTWILFEQTLQDFNVAIKNKAHWQAELAKHQSLTPGDFATVIRQNRLNRAGLTIETLLQGLAAEVQFKKQSQSRGIGFTAAL